MFISFAPPKEMNQRKGGRKRQPVPLAALRVGTGSHLFRLANAPGYHATFIKEATLRISTGLREFWDRTTECL
jgi:hypothetical protein